MNPFDRLGLQLPQVPTSTDDTELIKSLITQQLQAPSISATASIMPSADQARDLAQAQVAHDAASDRQYAFGNLGLLSGDSVLGKFGQAQLNDIKAFNPLQFRGQSLIQAQQRLKLQADAEARKSAHASTSDAIKHLLSLQGLSGQARTQLLEIAKLQNSMQNQQQSQETGMRKEFLEHPITKDFNKSQVSFQQLQAAAKDPSPQGDIALVYGAMHVYDPNSVVRETEFATAENAASVPERLRARWNKLLSGTRLTDAERADIIKTAGGQFAVRQQAYDNLRKHYESLATATGATPSHVTMEDLPTDIPVKAPTMEDLDALGKNPNPKPGETDVDLTKPLPKPSAKQLLVKPPTPAPPAGPAARLLLKQKAASESDDGPPPSAAEASKAIAAARAAKTAGQPASSYTGMTEAEKQETKDPHLQRAGESVEATYNRVRAASMPNSPDFAELRVVQPKVGQKMKDLVTTGEAVRVANRKGETLAVAYNNGRGIRWLAVPHGFLDGGK